jgi:hypothetical protein
MIDDCFSTNSTGPVDNFVEKSRQVAAKARKTRESLACAAPLKNFQCLKNQDLANIPQMS